ncbi:CDP-glucose 4,6-dehydratase [Ferrovum sp. PN-J185]|uniref:CDP-glucose 4,6-dehydratase n=1 Tax=Ferrovum sp. PN-J185 TaxID=1356306 RepID=UPI001E58DB21|nr:CDP-glucose 4,6-dehydratase [Ferrovum sp. PN-J185]MCC6068771.1 CDP-glucose 4,6-dehydratase [Ferrovum sp. PN-J185]
MENMVMFHNIYKNKKVLITGNTGFKGSWLTTWLLELGANICGISDKIPTTPSLFSECNLEKKINHIFCDVRDTTQVSKIIESFKPDFIFHLAAQAIVSTSYEFPLETISTNVLGTASLLEALRHYENECIVIIITSDKCYENVEWVWGYKETDKMGGKDIYSASKGSAELIFNAYYNSFLQHKINLRISTARAGNVIGGGDWAKDRIVVDCIKKWIKGEPVDIRSPFSTRPWQHVLEPLSGYLHLGYMLHINKNLNGSSYNFGPRSEQNRTVIELIEDLYQGWESVEKKNPYNITENIPFHEAGLLKLNCDKSLFDLKWVPSLEYKECVNMVSKWYSDFYNRKKYAYELTRHDIREYEHIAFNKSIVWTKK